MQKTLTQYKKKIQKIEANVRNFWDKIQVYQHSNHWGARRRKQSEIENVFEKIMKENFPNLVKEIDIQVQEAQTVPNKCDPKRTTPRHIIIKMPKVKDRES